MPNVSHVWLLLFFLSQLPHDRFGTLWPLQVGPLMISGKNRPEAKYDFCLKTKQDFAAIILCSVLNFSVGCVVFSASKNKSENHWRGDGRRTWIITSSEQTRTSERNEALR